MLKLLRNVSKHCYLNHRSLAVATKEGQYEMYQKLIYRLYKLTKDKSSMPKPAIKEVCDELASGKYTHFNFAYIYNLITIMSVGKVYHPKLWRSVTEGFTMVNLKQVKNYRDYIITSYYVAVSGISSPEAKLLAENAWRMVTLKELEEMEEKVLAYLLHISQNTLMNYTNYQKFCKLAVNKIKKEKQFSLYFYSKALNVNARKNNPIRIELLSKLREYLNNVTLYQHEVINEPIKFHGLIALPTKLYLMDETLLYSFNFLARKYIVDKKLKSREDVMALISFLANDSQYQASLKNVLLVALEKLEAIPDFPTFPSNLVCDAIICLKPVLELPKNEAFLKKLEPCILKAVQKGYKKASLALETLKEINYGSKDYWNELVPALEKSMVTIQLRKKELIPFITSCIKIGIDKEKVINVLTNSLIKEEMKFGPKTLAKLFKAILHCDQSEIIKKALAKTMSLYIISYYNNWQIEDFTIIVTTLKEIEGMYGFLCCENNVLVRLLLTIKKFQRKTAGEVNLAPLLLYSAFLEEKLTNKFNSLL